MVEPSNNPDSVPSRILSRDPELILDGGDVEEDKRARSQIKGKAGKSGKVKSSTNFATPTPTDALVHYSNVCDPNLVLGDIETTDSFNQSCDEAHEVIDKLSDPTLEPVAGPSKGPHRLDTIQMFLRVGHEIT